MKKLLALVLALVMTLGLATVSSNAAFSDAEDIEYTEAVAVMNAIGVLQGDDNGAFNPKDTLTREQGAKIISYMLMGGKTGGDALNAATAPFSDVAADRWSAGSVAFCKNSGILAGVGDGSFNPTGELTGAAFCKMLLAALGYNANKEGLTGADWQLNVARLVNKIDLAHDLGAMQYGQPITRDVAAKLAFNALSEDMVEYLGAFTVTTSDGTVVDSATQATSVLNAAYSYKSDGNAQVATANMQFCENYFPTLKVEETIDDFGVAENKWFLAGSRTDYLNADEKVIVSEAGDDLIAIFTEAVTPKQIRNAIGTTAADRLVAKNAALAAGDTDRVVCYVDGRVYGTFAANILSYIDDNGDIKAPLSGNGVVTRIYRDADTRNVTISFNGIYLAKTLANYDTSNKKVAVTVYAPNGGYNTGLAATWPTEIKSKDFDNLEGLKKDDYLLVTATKDGTKWKFQSVEPVADTIAKTTVSAYRAAVLNANDNGTVTVGGTNYKFSRTLLEGAAFATTGFNVNKDSYDFYLDNNGYIVGIKEVEATVKAEDYLFVRDVSYPVGSWDAKAKVTFMEDGSEATITVSKITDDLATAGTLVEYKVTAAQTAGTDMIKDSGDTTRDPGELTKNVFFKYSKKSNGEYELKWDTTTMAEGTTNSYLVAGSLTPINAVPGVTANSKTVTVAKKTAYVGVSNIPSVGGVGDLKTIYYLVDGTTLLAIYTNNNGSTTSDLTKYAYLWADKTTSKSGDDTYYVYNAIVDGALTTIESEDDKGAGLYDISTTDKKNWVELGTAIAAPEGLVTAVDATTAANTGKVEVKDGTLMVEGASVAVVNDSTRYFKIDTTKTDVNVEEIGDATVLTLDENATDIWTAYVFKANDSAKVASMVYLVKSV